MWYFYFPSTHPAPFSFSSSLCAFSFRTAPYYISIKDNKDKKKTKRVQKTYRYPVMEYHEELNLDLSLHLQLDRKPSQLSHSKRVKHRTESTKASFAKAKVRPKSADFMNTTSTVESNFSDLSAKLSRSLREQWASRYCHGVWQDFSRTESLFRCYRVRSDQTSVVAWFKSHFHLSPSDYLISVR